MNPDYKPLIKQMWQRPSSMTDLMEATGCTMNQVSYRIAKLLKANLVVQVDEVARKGRSIKLYSMTNRKYIVPFSQTKNASAEEFLAAQLMNQQSKFSNYFTRHIIQHQKYIDEPYFSISEEEGEVVMKINFEEERDACISIWLNVNLNTAQVDELQEEIQRLVGKYDTREEGEPHLLCFQLAPVYEE